MRRLNLYLLVPAIFFMLLHAGYFVYESTSKKSGAYFNSTTVFLKAGDTLKIDFRLQFQDNGVHVFQQSDSWSLSAFRKIESSALGNLRLVTETARISLLDADDYRIDGDLVFGNEYAIKKGTPFTLYKVPAPSGNICFYLRELSRLNCFNK